MEEIKISDDVFEQIKDFERHLTEEENLLVDKLILNEELKQRFKAFYLCKECKQPNTGSNYWCRPCNAKRFQQNFKNWTSGNCDVDKFIQKTQLEAKNCLEVLEWIEYDRFEDIKYLAKGGFGTTYKAIWKDGYIYSWDPKNNKWKRSKHYEYQQVHVVLKCLHNSQNITAEFLREVELHVLVCANANGWIIRCYGITKDPETNNFMMVMNFVENGSLRQHLDNCFVSLDWKKKLDILRDIAKGLKEIHDSGLIHHDFHCGNLLNNTNGTFITDLGLCQPANVKSSQNDDKEIYGVLPYVAPEVLRGKVYTQDSDIYAFGIIAYEVCTGLPPYHDIDHEEFLAIKICEGLRPTSNYEVPQLILDVIVKCWDADPSKRPKIAELLNELIDLRYNNSTISEQFKEVDEINEKSSSQTVPSLSSTGMLSYTTHSQAIYTSRILDFKNLPEPRNADDDDLEFMRI
ncbi:kinase-like domain-containing protein [Glomus cerebriforme]|uniref:Kinase-like domain-containing protein n=1 Tax=Glomus cerebriforme TaxID=658196 RepID=A0A397SJZ1_9GLOM|nr:kinase-like domain-containing protein [Glomus cerebriforme]